MGLNITKYIIKEICKINNKNKSKCEKLKPKIIIKQTKYSAKIKKSRIFKWSPSIYLLLENWALHMWLALYFDGTVMPTPSEASFFSFWSLLPHHLLKQGLSCPHKLERHPVTTQPSITFLVFFSARGSLPPVIWGWFLCRFSRHYDIHEHLPRGAFAPVQAVGLVTEHRLLPGLRF